MIEVNVADDEIDCKKQNESWCTANAKAASNEGCGRRPEQAGATDKTKPSLETSYILDRMQELLSLLQQQPP